jgi:transposase-like protein
MLPASSAVNLKAWNLELLHQQQLLLQSLKQKSVATGRRSDSCGRSAGVQPSCRRIDVKPMIEDCMKPLYSLVSLFTVLFIAAAMGFAQTGCEFRVAGDWESTAPGESIPHLYRFAQDGTVTAFTGLRSGQRKKLARAAFNLESPQDPKTLEFKSIPGGGSFPWGPGKTEITHFDSRQFTLKSGSELTAWVKKDPYRYFVILAAHRGTPPHWGGPALGMLVKTGGGDTEVETFGLYYQDGQRINGPVPEELYRQYMIEPASEQDTMLRLQVTAEEFDRGLNIVRSWQRRAREGALLFPAHSYLNIVVPLKEIAESLNQCGEAIKLYKLTWLNDDPIGANTAQWELAFEYVKKLRDLNQLLHVPDKQFQQSISSRLQGPQSQK